MNFLFLMDPLATVVPHKDTSLALMVGALERGHKVFFLPDGGMSREDRRTIFNVTSLVPSFDAANTFSQQQTRVLTDAEVDVIMIRSDPPFDAEYLMNTWLLDLLPKRITVVNNPSGIRGANEKIWPTQFAGIMPPTCIARQRDDIQKFIAKQGDVVVKPTGGFGGQSVFHIRQGDSNKNVILETLTNYWTREIVVQRYVPEAKKGDKRILLLNGDPLGAVMRIQAEDDHRHNFFTGGKPHPADINDRDRFIIEQLKPYLRTMGLCLAGIDILGDYLTEVNVTSPTGMQEMNRLYNLKLHHQVIEFVEKMVDQ